MGSLEKLDEELEGVEDPSLGLLAGIEDSERPHKKLGKNPMPPEASSAKNISMPLNRSNFSGSQPITRDRSLKRAESRLGRQYDNVQPKVNSRLDAKYIPEPSQVRVPRYKRSSKTSYDSQITPSLGLENEYSTWDGEGSAQGVENPDGHSTRTGTPMFETDARPSSSEETNHFSKSFIDSSGISSPYSYDPESPLGSETDFTAQKITKSRSTSRIASEKHPTSNPADYAKSTSSFQNKMSENPGYEMIEPSRSLSESRVLPARRRPLPKRFTTEPAAETPTEKQRQSRSRKTVKFMETVEPEELTGRKQAYSDNDMGYFEETIDQKYNMTTVKLGEDGDEGQMVVENRESSPEKPEEASELAANRDATDREKLIEIRQEAKIAIEYRDRRITELEEAVNSKDRLELLHAQQVSQIEEAMKENSSQAEKIVELEHQLKEARDSNEVDHAAATGTDTSKWFAVYQRGKTLNAAQENDIKHLRESIIELNAYIIYLERELKESTAYGIAHRDAADTLHHEIQRYKSLAENWKHEYEQQKAMREQGNLEEGPEITNLREELQKSIAEYQALMPSKDDPDALEKIGLMRKIDIQRKIIEQNMRHHEKLKKENANLQEEFEKSIAKERELLKEIERVKHGTPPPPRAIFDGENNEEIRLPEWNFSELTQKRENAVAEFKKKQREARDAKEAEYRLMEKAREAKMGKWHPPKRNHFEHVQQKSSWERWDGRRWLEEQASADDYETAKQLGLLNDRKKQKGWNTQDWKGKSLASMGLKGAFNEQFR